jgi:hypothetical protein
MPENLSKKEQVRKFILKDFSYEIFLYKILTFPPTGRGKREKYDKFLECFGWNNLNKSVGDTLAGIIGANLKEKLPTQIRQKMQNQGGL